MVRWMNRGKRVEDMPVRPPCSSNCLMALCRSALLSAGACCLEMYCSGSPSSSWNWVGWLVGGLVVGWVVSWVGAWV